MIWKLICCQIEDQAILPEYPKVYSEGKQADSEFSEALMELQRSENDQKSVQLEENFSNVVVLQRKAYLCDDSEKEPQVSDVVQDDSNFSEGFMQFQESEYDSESAEFEADFTNPMFLQSEFDEEDNVIEDFLFSLDEENVVDAKMQQKFSFAQSKVEEVHIQSCLNEIFLDPTVQNQMMNQSVRKSN
ncbi:hypothetical protein L7F22_004745 [Adiantum nelumboides]|nr:hypothetical protein [Adiantum nelumboides]